MSRRNGIMVLLAGGLISLCGCAAIKDIPKGFIGVSTRSLEDARPQALTKIFRYNYATSYNKAGKILSKFGCYLYAKNFKKHLIAVYVSPEDTTPVGVFFKEIDLENTEVQVASMSASAKEYIARRLFAVMAGLPDPDMKKDEKKESAAGEKKEEKAEQKKLF